MKLFHPLLPTVLIKLSCILITISYSCCEEDLNVHYCRKSEEEALLLFKEGFKIPSSSNPLSSWDPEVDCCKWKGVGCNSTTGHVNSLNLSVTNSSDRLIIIRDVLSSSLLDLPCLRSLDLSGNDFKHTEMPECIGSLHNLEHLNLSGTNIRGILSYHLGNLSHLQSLDLSHNGFYLSVNNLDWLHGLSSLKKLDLSMVQVDNVENWFDVINALPSLVELRLSACRLPNLPYFLPYVNISSLQVLDLSLNGFHVTIPHWLFEIRDIQHVNLSNNGLSGQIPDKFEHWKSLVFLDLSMNNLSGPIPSTLGQTQGQNGLIRSSSLKELHLSDNHLGGRLEKSLVQFSGLEVLDVSDNDFEGILVDSHFLNLKSLRFLDLSSNNLRLNMSDNWVPPFQLEYIGLRSVQTGHSFPNWLQSQKNFLHFDVSNANISGFVPNWFWHLSPKVEYLNLSRNNLGGCVYDLSSNFNLHTLDLTENRFHCLLPHFPPNIGTLKLHKNSFYGPISHVCDILDVNNSLFDLDLSSNNLSGNIPDCWEHGRSLIFLNLEDNDLSGHIPDSFGGLQRLTALYLRQNNLFGEISTSLQNSIALTYLSLSENQLSGVIPAWIGDYFQHLLMLDLASNALEGNIPTQLCQLKLLQILDLSGNRLSGGIPRCVFTAMSVADSDHAPIDMYDPYNMYRKISLDLFLAYGYTCNNLVLNKLSYYLPGFAQYSLSDTFMCQRSTMFLTVLDFSSNSLTGEIPEEITKHAGLNVLNLSRNHLMGSIPSGIGNMTDLEFLDLSWNWLTCSIPTSMINLSFLAVLDVSYNNLTGKIPVGMQLNTFTKESFLGNKNLCGVQLALPCSTNESYEDQHCRNSKEHEGIVEHEGQKDNTMSLLETSSFYISMVLGFITGFWAFWVPLVLITSWRHSYFRFIDRVTDYIYVIIAVAAAKFQRKYLTQ